MSKRDIHPMNAKLPPADGHDYTMPHKGYPPPDQQWVFCPPFCPACGPEWQIGCETDVYLARLHRARHRAT